MREKGTDKYDNVHTQAVAIEFSKRRKREPSTLRTFCRRKECFYTKARQGGQPSAVIQSALCEVAFMV